LDAPRYPCAQFLESGRKMQESDFRWTDNRNTSLGFNNQRYRENESTRISGSVTYIDGVVAVSMVEQSAELHAPKHVKASIHDWRRMSGVKEDGPAGPGKKDTVTIPSSRSCSSPTEG
jgi:hypothetical protein